MHTAVKITEDNWGDKRKSPKWHLSVTDAGTSRTLCEGEAFGMGDSGAKFKEKICERGGITCEACLKKIKWFKNIKL